MHRTDQASHLGAPASSSRKVCIMDAPRFDRWTRSLTNTASRRSVLGLAGAALGLATTRLPGIATAKKKSNKKAPKKLTRNSFGCVDVGKACRGNSDNCCSGICDGKKPKRGKQDRSRCVAHHTSSCQATDDFCEGTVTGCGTGGACARTTGQASFCAMIGGSDACTSCRGDSDCEQALGPGAACIVCAAGCPVGQHTACVQPDLGTAI
jgi:hypothetical protein